MSGTDLGMSFWSAAAGSVLLFLVYFVLSSLLALARSLSPLTPRRLGVDDGEHLAFLEALAGWTSPLRLTALVSRQVCLLAGCILAGTAASLAGWPRPWLAGLVVGLLAGVLVLEAVAANLLAARYPGVVVWIAAPLTRGLYLVAFPLVRVLAPVLARFRREVAEGDENGEEDSDAEAEALIEAAEREGILEEDEGRMMRGIVDLDETRVREIMTPRTDVVGLESSLTVKEAIKLIREASHSRFPVYGKSIDEVVGILHVRDLLSAWDDGREGAPVTAYVRPALFVPETLSVGDLLEEMRVRTHVALVVDEYGGIAGLVTLENLLEEIVGEIRDEHDVEEDPVLAQPDGSWMVSGLAHIKELEDLFDLDLEDERAFDTVGGLVVSTLGRVPVEGESLEIHGLRIEVVQADPRRVYRVRLRKISPCKKPNTEE